MTEAILVTGGAGFIGSHVAAELLAQGHDDIILETAIQGGATYVVSRDEDVTRDLDLLDHLRERGIETITVQRFLVLL